MLNIGFSLEQIDSYYSRWSNLNPLGRSLLSIRSSRLLFAPLKFIISIRVSTRSWFYRSLPMHSTRLQRNKSLLEFLPHMLINIAMNIQHDSLKQFLLRQTSILLRLESRLNRRCDMFISFLYSYPTELSHDLSYVASFYSNYRCSYSYQ